MQNHLRNFIACSIAFVLFGCSNSENKSEKLAVTADSAINSNISSSTALENTTDIRKFIRKADLKFRVNDVIQSTYEIESITAKMHGFVTHTQLSSTIENEDRTEMSSDSTLVSTSFRVNNSISIRVPNTLLDSTLKEIAKQITFLDYRSIDAEDVHLQLLASELTEKRNEHFQNRILSSGTKSEKKNSSLSAEESLLMTQEQKDNAHIDILKINDQVNYSSVGIYIYQNPTIKHEMIPNNKTDAFEPNFFYKLLESIKTGWHSLIALVLYLIKFWAFLLVATIMYFGWKVFWNRKP
jgi:hypothetical protein